MSKIINVILSGGSGTRLWPLSRQSRPKQFLKMFERKSLFQHAVLRNSPVVDDFLLLTNKEQENQAVNQMEELTISLKHKVIEPIGRNTAAAIALAAMRVDPEDILFVTPSDHMIKDEQEYNKSIHRAITIAKKGFLVTFGIKPEYPETGYGYIESNKEDVISFREKPDYKTAVSFIEQKNFYWNSGMFCFKASVYLSELKKYRNDIYETSKAASKSSVGDHIKLDYMVNIPDESIDYAVFERSDLVKTVESFFQWTDLGSFDALISYFKKTNNIEGVSKFKGVDNFNAYGISGKEIYGINVENLVVVDTEDCILVLPNDGRDRIKELYNSVKAENEILVK